MLSGFGNQKKISFLLLCWFAYCPIHAQKNLPHYSVLHQKIQKYLFKDSSPEAIFLDSVGLHKKNQLWIHTDSLKILQTAYYKQNFLRYGMLMQQKWLGIITGKPLLGWRIALDPGHFAGNLETAKVEGKYLQMQLPDSTYVEFWESHLAWATAKILQKKLENAGATVMLTRSQPYFTAFEKSFEDIYQEYVRRILDRHIKLQKPIKRKMPLSRSAFFQTSFRKAELEERVRKINAFQPHITLIIHYNVDEKNEGWKKTVNKNFAMAFVGGAFSLKDLEKKEEEEDFLRLLCSQELERSIALSQYILQAHQRVAKVPIVEVQNDQDYLQEKCLFTGIKGVYTRNLLLARAVRGIVCYGESLLQDSEQEIRILNRKTLEIDRLQTSPRVLEIAEAYFTGILAYCQEF
jgi:N-acetylmuramoyl-L-alanine amidase